MKKTIVILSLLAIIVGGVGWALKSGYIDSFIAEKSETPSEMAQKVPLPVGVAEVYAGELTQYITALGNVTPRNSVIVKSQLDGRLLKLHFKEGQLVTQGDLLAEIDSRELQAQLKQAEGQMKRDSALLAEAKANLVRYKQLATQGSVAVKQLDAQTSLVKQYEGAVENNQGRIEAVKVQLQYANITAPISGRVGLRQVDVGNLVRTTDKDGIVTISEIQPINVAFAITEKDIPLLKNREMGKPTIIEAWDKQNKNQLAIGVLTAIDNQLDSATGTLKMKAEFSNKNRLLFPNQFVNIRLRIKSHDNVLFVPAVAAKTTTKGSFVYVVTPELTAALRQVRLGPKQGNRISVTSGLRPSEKVIIDGFDGLKPNRKIEISYVEKAPAEKPLSSAKSRPVPSGRASPEPKAPQQQMKK